MSTKVWIFSSQLINVVSGIKSVLDFINDKMLNVKKFLRLRTNVASPPIILSYFPLSYMTQWHSHLVRPLPPNLIPSFVLYHSFFFFINPEGLGSCDWNLMCVITVIFVSVFLRSLFLKTQQEWEKQNTVTVFNCLMSFLKHFINVVLIWRISRHQDNHVKNNHKKF